LTNISSIFSQEHKYHLIRGLSCQRVEDSREVESNNRRRKPNPLSSWEDLVNRSMVVLRQEGSGPFERTPPSAKAVYGVKE
jgi:hypothetical protein